LNSIYFNFLLTYQKHTRTPAIDQRSDLFLHFLNPKIRPTITPDTTRTDTAARIKIIVRRLNKREKKKVIQIIKLFEIRKK
jgi:hypothetical protein